MSRRRIRGLLALAFVGVAVAFVVATALEGRQSDASPAGDSLSSAAAKSAPALPATDAFDDARAWKGLKRQVALGERPTGSPSARRLSRWARQQLPRGRFESVDGGARNVVGTIPGTRPAIVVAAHYDTKAMKGFVGANDGASGTAVVLELARIMRSMRRPKHAPELRFVLFDGEESPDDARDFYSTGLRGSRAYARRHRDEIRAVVVLDMIGDRNLLIPRESSSDPRLWGKLRRAAREVGTAKHFPSQTRGAILDDHTPFQVAGLPAIDVIDFTFSCWHKTCDDLSAVSPKSLDIVGETVTEMLKTWR
ncbi:MAG: M28 family metallopeptidase [Actinomycetota bacterium]|nr:M28 family metallopeptidase [Actinomycetota bacterium]